MALAIPATFSLISFDVPVGTAIFSKSKIQSSDFSLLQWQN
jgi:hypothetical protein